MLLKSRISNVKMVEDGQYSQAWKKARLGRFTSSNAYKLMKDKKGAQTYIETRVWECLSGVSSESDILNDSIVHGIAYESKALMKFGQALKLPFLIQQVLVFGEDQKESSTPDALIKKGETPDELLDDVFPVEAKCFQPANHTKCAQCETAQDLKEVDDKTYWQILHQMRIVNSLKGFAVFYDPSLLEDMGGLRIINFRVYETTQIKGVPIRLLQKDLELMNQTMAAAKETFEKVKAKMLRKNQSNFVI